MEIVPPISVTLAIVLAAVKGKPLEVFCRKNVIPARAHWPVFAEKLPGPLLVILFPPGLLT